MAFARFALCMAELQTFEIKTMWLKYDVHYLQLLILRIFSWL